MPVVLRRQTYERILTDREHAEVDRDLWERQATEATANAANVMRAVDSALCALELVHHMDPETGVCACGHASPCPSGKAVAELMPYWDSMPVSLVGIIDRGDRAA